MRQRRRSFLSLLLATSTGALVAAVLYPVARYLIPPPQAESSAASVTLNLEPAAIGPNSGQIFKFGNEPGILLRTPAGELRAFSAVCTHLGCTVQYRPDLRQIWCACHNGHYDLSGRNIAGPPPRPLSRWVVNARADNIVITRTAAA